MLLKQKSEIYAVRNKSKDLFFVKNKDMKKPIELNEVIDNARSNNLDVLLLINGEYYDITRGDV